MSGAVSVQMPVFTFTDTSGDRLEIEDQDRDVVVLRAHEGERSAEVHFTPNDALQVASRIVELALAAGADLEAVVGR